MKNNSYRYLFFVILIALGLLGNFFKFSLFLNVDFIFGSIFALLALQFFGAAFGVLAAALISLMTFFLWNHPYAIIIMTAEAAFIAFLMRKKKMGLVVADVLYWIFIGMPLIYFFYHIVMKVPSGNVSILLIKQAINGIANALVARLLFSICILRNRSSILSYKDIIYNLLGFFVIFPSLIILSLSARSDFERTDHEIKLDLSRDSDRLHELLKNWVFNRQSSITSLAEMAKTRTPEHMQIHLEQAVKGDKNFLRIGLHDSNTIVVAHYPLKDESGKSTLGKSFTDRAYIPIIKKELRPFLTEVVKSRIGRPVPVVTTLTPIVKKDKFNGYVIGVLNLSQLVENFNKASIENTMHYALLDRNNKVILTNMPDQRPLFPFARDNGHLSALSYRGLDQWVPDLSPNTPASEKWKNTYYVATSSVGEFDEWKLILEQPIAPFQKRLNDSYFNKMFVLFFIMLVALFLAELLSRKIIYALEELNVLTNDLPQRLAARADDLPWPKSGFLEARQLIDHFKIMARSLSSQFQEIKKINESLEIRVEERTKELKRSERQLLMAQEISHTGSWSYEINSDYFFASAEGMNILGYPPVAGFVRGEEIFALIPDADRIREALRQLIEHEVPYDVEFSILPRNGGTYRMVHSIGTLEKDESGKVHKILGFIEDITERHKRHSETRFLAEAGEILSESLENEETIFKIAELVTVDLADGCLIRLFREDGSFGFRVITHKDENKRKCFTALIDSFESKKYLPKDVLEVTQKENVVIHQKFNEELVHESAINDEDKKNISSLGTFSTALIPLKGHNQILGIMRLISEVGNRGFNENDVPFLENVGNRIGLSLENARLYDETRRAVKAREEILAIVSHDLRNPLSAIQMTGQLLPRIVKNDERVATYSQKILRSTGQMQRMIADLMDFAKIQAGTLAVEKKTECPREIAESVSEIMRPQAEEKGVEFSYVVNEGVPELFCDKQRIVQALMNLLGNAIKFTEAGGKVHLLVEHTDQGTRFSVTDTGPGISKVDLPKIFDRYWQARKSKNASAGLGLSITKAIIDAHQGQISVQSEVGVGSTFSFIIS